MSVRIQMALCRIPKEVEDREGYVFAGWDKEASATEAAVIFMVSCERCMIIESKSSEGGKTYFARYQAQQDRCDRAEEYYKEYCGEVFD